MFVTLCVWLFLKLKQRALKRGKDWCRNRHIGSSLSRSKRYVLSLFYRCTWSSGPTSTSSCSPWPKSMRYAFICAVISSQNHKRTSAHVFLSVLSPLWTQLLFVFRRSCLFTRVQRRNMQRRYWTSWTRRENCLGKSPRDLLPLVCRSASAQRRRRAPRRIYYTQPASVCLLLVPAVTCWPQDTARCACGWMMVTPVKMSLNVFLASCFL